MNPTIRSKARLDVRTRSTGVISRSSVRIGLILSAPPSHACAAPIRPPRRRYSRVSTANQKRSAPIAPCAAAATSSRPASARARAPAASTTSPSAPAPTVESTTSIRASGWLRATSAAAWRAPSTVPDIPPERWIETISRPDAASGSYTARKSPTEGCEVVGSVAASRRPA